MFIDPRKWQLCRVVTAILTLDIGASSRFGKSYTDPFARIGNQSAWELSVEKND